MVPAALPPGVDFSAVRGKRLLIALSGGSDSVALAAMLASERKRLGLSLCAAHLDHGIRAESAADAQWCRKLCKALDIPFYTARMDVPAESARRGEGLETVARRLRHGWLLGLREALGADYIALAHHMDDQAETVLMHLARGTGPQGIGGMSELSGALYRPLLGVRKRALADYLARRGLDWREDATNAVADNARNALRLHGIPALEKSYPQIVPAIARYAQSARIESDFVERQARLWIDGRVEAGPYGRLLRFSEAPHPAILRRAVRAMCPEEAGWERVNAVAALSERAHGAEEIHSGLYAERGRLGIYFLRREAPDMREAPLALQGGTALSGLCEIDAQATPAVPVRDDPFCQVLDADALEGAVLRTRRAGDRIRPLGCGERLLSDYLTDKKLDRPLRGCTALVARGSEVLWACGLGISERARLTASTRRAVSLKCRYTFKWNINK